MGVLRFKGQLHHFTMSSVGAGGMGAQSLVASGAVYHLHALQDFAGSYRSFSQGLTLIEGKMSAKLTNANGVEIYLSGKTEGVATSTGVQVFEITLKD